LASDRRDKFESFVKLQNTVNLDGFDKLLVQWYLGRVSNRKEYNEMVREINLLETPNSQPLHNIADEEHEAKHQ